MRVLTYYLLAMLWPALQAIAQLPANSIRPLAIGDTVPDIVFRDLLNHHTETAKLSDFKGKLVILDFWATWCGACIHGFPKLDRLQSRFAQELKIIAVTREPVEKIKKFLSTRKKENIPAFVFAAGDSMLSTRFPYRILPHQVWIDENRVVVAITGQQSATDENVSKFIAGEKIILPIKRDLLYFNKEASFHENNIVDEAIGVSVVTGYIEGLFSGYGRRVSSDSSHLRLFYVNRPIIELYRNALHVGDNVPVVLEVLDTSRYLAHQANRVPARYYFCYELSVPVSFSEPKIKQIMLQDLDRYLGLHGRLESRSHPCYVLKKISRQHARTKKTPAPTGTETYTVSKLMSFLQNGSQKLPEYPGFIDESGYAGTVQISRPEADGHFIENVNAALAANGLMLKKSRRKITVLVLTETDF